MGIQIFFQILDPKASSPIIYIPSFFVTRVKRVPKIIHHFLCVAPLLYLQKRYLNMLLDFKYEKFIPRYACSFDLTRSSERVLKIIRHFIHVGPLLKLKSWYPNMLSDLGSENSHYSHSFTFCEFPDKNPKKDLSLRASGATFTIPK